MNMKVKDVAASNAILPTRMRTPIRTSSPLLDSEDESAREHQSASRFHAVQTPSTAVEYDSHMEAVTANISTPSQSKRAGFVLDAQHYRGGQGDGGAAASAAADETRARMSRVDAIVQELRTRHEERLSESLRSIGVLRQTTPSVASLDQHKSPASNKDRDAASHSDDAIKPSTGTTSELKRQVGGDLKHTNQPSKRLGPVIHGDDAVKLSTGTASELKGQVGGDLKHPIEPSKGLGPENAMSRRNTPVIASPACKATNRCRLSTSPLCGGRPRHLTPLYVDGQLQTPPPAEVVVSARSGDTVTSADTGLRDDAAVTKASNSSDYDADDDDEGDSGEIRVTPTAVVSQWALETEDKSPSHVDEWQDTVEQQVGEEINGTKQHEAIKPNEAEEQATEGDERGQESPIATISRLSNIHVTPENVIISPTVDSFENVRNYLMTYVPEIGTQIPEVRTEPSEIGSETPAQPLAKQQQV